MYSVFLFVFLVLFNISFSEVLVNRTDKVVKGLVRRFLPPNLQFIVDGSEAVLGMYLTFIVYLQNLLVLKS